MTHDIHRDPLLVGVRPQRLALAVELERRASWAPRGPAVAGVVSFL